MPTRYFHFDSDGKEKSIHGVIAMRGYAQKFVDHCVELKYKSVGAFIVHSFIHFVCWIIKSSPKSWNQLANHLRHFRVAFECLNDEIFEFFTSKSRIRW